MEFLEQLFGQFFGWHSDKLQLHTLSFQNQTKPIQVNLCQKLLFLHQLHPQYDDRLFIELQIQYIHENSKLKPGENMLCTEIVSDIQNNFCTQHVLQNIGRTLFSLCSAKRRASDKNLAQIFVGPLL